MMNPFQGVLDRQKQHFATGVTRSYLWRVEQLDRIALLVEENEHPLQRAVSKDFKTASQEQVFETLAWRGEIAFQKSQLQDWMAPTEAPVPRAFAATGHRGIVCRDPYAVALIIGSFNFLVRLQGARQIGRKQDDEQLHTRNGPDTVC